MKKQISILMMSAVLLVSACAMRQGCMEEGCASCPTCAGKTGPKTPAYFAFDSDQLTREDKVNLDKIAQKLEKYPDKKIKICGFTDDIGTKAYNQALSVRRAQNAARYLESKGVAPNRMTIMGYGASRFADTNATSKGRAQNRRVEIHCD